MFSKCLIVGSISFLEMLDFCHNGVWEKLHNKSVKTIIEISNAKLNQLCLNLQGEQPSERYSFAKVRAAIPKGCL